jgi:hypothetical protein
LSHDRGPDRLGGPRRRGVHRCRQGRVSVGGEVPVEGADQAVGLPGGGGFGVRAGPPRDAGEIPPRSDPRRPMPAASGVGEQVPVDARPHLVGHMQTHRLRQVVTHPPAGLDMRPGGRFDTFACQPQTLSQRLRIAGPFVVGRPVRLAPPDRVTLHCPPQPKHRPPLPFQALARTVIRHIELEADHRHRAAIDEVRCFRLAPPPRHHHRRSGRAVGGRGCHGPHATTNR